MLHLFFFHHDIFLETQVLLRYLNVLHEPGVGGLVRAGEGGAPGGPEAAPPLLVELHARQAVRAPRGAEPAVHSHATRRRGVQGWKTGVDCWLT